MKNFAILCVFLCACTSLDGLGSAGESCFPNLTCNQPNTCFKVGGENLCYLEVKPAILDGAKICYTFNKESETGTEPDEQTKCFDTFDECITNFGEILSKPGKVIRGCAYQGV